MKMLPFIRRQSRSKKSSETSADSLFAPFDPHSLANKLQVLALEEPDIARGIEAIVDGVIEELAELDDSAK